MLPEFEEKQYEYQLTLELASTRHVFSIGQNLEHHIGLDIAVFSRSKVFWSLWAQTRSRNTASQAGLPPSASLWGQFAKELNSSEFPPFRCNLFLQIKRAEFLSSGRALERAYWRGPYYRYEVSEEQQKILVHLQRKVNARALVLYAAPAFHLRRKLWWLVGRGEVVRNSSFVTPRTLEGHTRYTYDQGWGIGKAFSEQPEPIEQMSVENHLAETLSRVSTAESNTAFIGSLANAIMEVAEADGTLWSRLHADRFFHLREGLERQFAIIHGFMLYAGVSWYIVHESSQTPLGEDLG